MKFQEIKLKYRGMKQTYSLDEKTLLFSKQNSVGKSTLLRLLFFGIGYAIPGTYGLKFKDIEVQVSFVRDGKKYCTKRLSNYIELSNEGEFVSSRNLTGDDDDWFALIWGISSIRVLRNILGSIYMDQDKGWTLLNRGKVIGNIRFNIRDLLIGLAGDEKKLVENLAVLDERRKTLQQTRALLNIKEMTSQNNSVNYYQNEEMDETLNTQFKNLTLKKRVLLNNLRSVNHRITEQEGLTDFIESLHLMITNDEKSILVNKDNILRYNDNIDFLKQKSAWIQSDLDTINSKMEIIREKLAERTENLFHSEDVVQRTLADLSAVHVDEGVLRSREDELVDSMSELNKEIEAEFTEHNELIAETREWVQIFAERLGVSSVVKNKKYIFTRDLKSISGTIYYKVVFSFKMAYIKIIEKYTDVLLPIVLDSPSGREVTDRNIAEVINILNDYFKKNQIIIASINSYNLDGVTTIELQDRIFPDDISILDGESDDSFIDQ